MSKGVRDIWSRYWRAYGGAIELVKSPYFVAAGVVTVLAAGSWTNRLWWDTVVSVLPNVLGFTLGGYAILLSFGDEKFRAMLAATKSDSLDHNTETEPSPYRKLSASFLHFIVVQTLALVVALVAKGIEPGDRIIRAHIDPSLLPLLRIIELAASFLGYMAFIYALFAALAASFYVFRLSTWFELFASGTKPAAVAPAATEVKADAVAPPLK